ncbi:uncharacterized protein LOC132904150 [Amyelois transitella]|uniref:uncharacterized protein LOC132904150 n=1 Tax=Amyelois transitella TaxID=680683 RepID=UPI0029904366|nr:uncharacterized protein LOC132904150 [Amyelois transitella]
MELGDEEGPPDWGGTSSSSRKKSSTPRPSKRPAESAIESEPKKTSPPSDSIQSVFHRPGFEPDSIIKYTDEDDAPFIVYVTRMEPDPSAGLSIKLLKFAQFLHQNSVSGIKSGGLKLMGRNKISIEFTDRDSANSFLENPLIPNNKYTASVPRFNISRMGVVRDIPTDWTLEELINNISVPPNCGQVVMARRLNSKSKKPDSSVSWFPTTTVVLTFRGHVLPERVFCFHTSLPVSVYLLPTIQCRNCCKFGHISKQCRSKPRCYRCGQFQHSGDSCSSDVPLLCLFCGNSHLATDPSCPEHIRQKQIKVIMANDNISYSEAAMKIPQKRSFSQVAAADTPASSQFYSSQSPVSSPQRPPNPPRSSAPNLSSSYKKTITISPKTRPELGKSYDIQALREITATPKSSLPNGCACSCQHQDPSTALSPNDNLFEILADALIQFLSRDVDMLPPNIISRLQQIIVPILSKHNGPSSSSVEY